jgi:hypothetical protein
MQMSTNSYFAKSSGLRRLKKEKEKEKEEEEKSMKKSKKKKQKSEKAFISEFV